MNATMPTATSNQNGAPAAVGQESRQREMLRWAAEETPASHTEYGTRDQNEQMDHVAMACAEHELTC